MPCGAILGDDAQLAFAALPRRKLGDIAIELGQIVRVHMTAPATLVQDLVHRITKDPIRRGGRPFDGKMTILLPHTRIKQIRGHAANQPVTRLAVPQRPLHALAFADIQEIDHRSHQLAVAVNGVRPVLHREAAAVLAPVHLAVHVRGFALQGGTANVAVFLGIRPAVRIGVMDEVMHVLAEHFLLRVAQHVEAGRVDEGAKALGVDPEDRLGR